MIEQRPPQPADTAAIRSQIQENLKRVYEAALTQEVPDRFRELLAQLREKEQEE